MQSLQLPVRRPYSNASAHCDYGPSTHKPPTPEPTATPTQEPTEVAPLDDEALTLAYVTAAIEYYGENGLDTTVEFYRSESSVENGRTLILLDEAEGTLLVFQNIPALQGQNVGPGSTFSGFAGMLKSPPKRVSGLPLRASTLSPNRKSHGGFSSSFTMA